MIHMASVWVPFTSESKEAIADYDEIRKEMKLALMECGRKLGTYLRKRMKMKREAERRDVFERYIGEIAKAINAINGTETKKLYEALQAQAKKRTAIADMQLDDEGKKIKEEDAADQEGVIIVESGTGGPPVPPVSGPSSGRGEKSTNPFAQSKSEAAMLKVAAMGKDDDDEPSLLDVKPVRRIASKPEKGKGGKTSSAPARKSPTKKSAEPPALTPPTSPTAPAPAVPAKAPKPRMRLVNGKQVPVEELPKLF
jgi:hypothetical protein